MGRSIEKRMEFPIKNGFKSLRESLGFNLNEMAYYLEMRSSKSYACYENGLSIPNMPEFVRMSNVAKSKGFDIKHTIYPQFCYNDNIPIVRESNVWIDVGSFLEFREGLGLSRREIVKLFDNNIFNDAVYIFNYGIFQRWESGTVEPRVSSGLLIDSVARANKMRLSDSIWSKEQNRKVFNRHLWKTESDKITNRKMKIVDQSMVLLRHHGKYRDMEALKKFEVKESIEIGEPKCPIDLLRRKLGLTESQFGDLIYVRGKGLTRMLDGEMIPSIHLAKVIQEEARKMGVAVTLDEIYQNVVVGDDSYEDS